MAFRQYRKASSGVDAAVQQLLYGLTIVTAPIWVPILLIVVAYNQCASQTPAAKAERAKVEAVRQAERVTEERRRAAEETRRQEAAYREAHEPWDALRCRALFTRTDRNIRWARDGSDSAAVQVPKLRQEATDHGCKR